MQLLLGYLPPDRALWSSQLANKRSQYKHFKDDLLINPVSFLTCLPWLLFYFSNHTHLNVSVPSQSEITRRIYNSTPHDIHDAKSHTRALLSRSQITHGDHPLSLVHTSIWNQFFQVLCLSTLFSPLLISLLYSAQSLGLNIALSFIVLGHGDHTTDWPRCKAYSSRYALLLWWFSICKIESGCSSISFEIHSESVTQSFFLAWTFWLDFLLLGVFSGGFKEHINYICKVEPGYKICSRNEWGFGSSLLCVQKWPWWGKCGMYILASSSSPLFLFQFENVLLYTDGIVTRNVAKCDTMLPCS